MMLKKVLWGIMAVILAVGGIAVVPTADAVTTWAPEGLRVNLLENPYGIPTMDPAFSWQMKDPESQEIQTAYQLVVYPSCQLKDPIADSGWVESRENTDVHLEGLSSVLQENHLYYWQVKTKDRAGNISPFSQPAHFMTHIGSQWQSLQGIWPQANPGNAELSEYQVEQTMSIATGDALAFLVNMDATGKNGYMVQIRNVDQVIKYHQITGGTINTTAFTTVNLREYGVTLPTDDTPFTLKLTSSGGKIWVSFLKENQYVDTQRIVVSNWGNRNAGTFGYRTGGRESGTIDDVTVSSMQGKVLYQTDFAKNDRRFGSLSVSGGKLQINKGAFACYSAGVVDQYANFAFFRSGKFSADLKKVDKAIVSLATRGTAADRNMIADLYINGTCLGSGSARELAHVGNFGGTSDYTKVYYNSFDATPYLQETNNVIGVVGNCLDANRGVLVQMTLFFQDGTTQVVTNSSVPNSGWKMLDGSYAFGDTGLTIETGYVSLLYENINANHYPAGWEGSDFDDSHWLSAQTSSPVADKTQGTTGRVLTPYGSENTLRILSAQPTATTYMTDRGSVLVDLGKEIIGGLSVNLDLPEAAQVTVHMGEELKNDGSVAYQLTATPVYEDVWELKKGNNRFRTVTMRNFRYVELLGLSQAAAAAVVQQKGIAGWAMMQPFQEEASSFAALDGSDAATLLNRLYDLSKYTIQATNQDVYVDSQARERAPYEGDLLVNANTSYSVSNNYSLARHSNEWLIDNPTWPNDYSIFMVEMAWLDLLYTGDLRSATAYYESLKKKLTVKVEAEDAKTGLIQAKNSQAGTTALIDWPTSERDGYKGAVYDVVLNSEYVGIYRYMAEIAQMLGKTQDVAFYLEKSERLKNTLITHAYNAETGRFYDSLEIDLTPTNHCSTHATAYALCYGVYDSQAMADTLAKFVYEKCEDHFMGSVYFTYFILKGLYNSGNGHFAQRLMTNPTVGENVKTFASLLDHLNCTITPEAWGHKWKGNMTLSHPWGASPGCSIVQGMFGIYPTTPGFYTFNIKLQPGEIQAASVTVPTVQGTVAAAYETTEHGMTAHITVPANTTATVFLPATKEHSLQCNGQPVTAALSQNKWLTVTLGSGEYELVTHDGSQTVAVSYGDVNHDGEIDAQDALLVLQQAVNKVQLDPAQRIAADVDGNGKLNAVDALLILQKAVNKILGFPVEGF